MEHIVQFAIGIDDKAIQNRIEEYAYKDVLDKIVKETMDTVFAHTNAYSRENMCKTMMEEALQSFLEERKDEIIDFLQKEWDAANNASDNPDEEVYDFYDGMTTAYEHVINYCRHLLGYSGTMPSEVPNQSEDAK